MRVKEGQKQQERQRDSNSKHNPQKDSTGKDVSGRRHLDGVFLQLSRGLGPDPRPLLRAARVVHDDLELLRVKPAQRR